jgi:polyketide biosynthesis enoyl-CoA hydratase PksH
VRPCGAHTEVVLTDPDRGNPLGPGLAGSLLDAVAAAEADPACRVVFVSAEGGTFCSGLDLDAAPGWPAGEAGMPVWRLFERLRFAEVITVALVNGRATGGGVALAAACDLVIAGEAAVFRFTEALLGLVPSIAIPFVADRVGEQHAFRMALTACEVGAMEAARLGLADEVRARATDGVRPLLVQLRRVTPDTVRALKLMRGQLFGKPPWLGETAAGASMRRLTNPAVAARIGDLRAAGALP